METAQKDFKAATVNLSRNSGENIYIVNRKGGEILVEFKMEKRKLSQS